MYSKERKEGDRKFDHSNKWLAQEILSAKDWDWIGCGAGFQENISGRVSAASAHQFLSLIGSLDYQNPLCKHCLITYHMIRVLQGSST